jgi:hypothetical protein
MATSPPVRSAVRRLHTRRDFARQGEQSRYRGRETVRLHHELIVAAVALERLEKDQQAAVPQAELSRIE